ncbi:MAG: cell envelope biogenesis protein OmpA [Winogradskyella sp.]|uniref:OmpA family protein n=1 Tax=Winogradskyella sp. TaxID=1883156 RepID=UPI000F3E0332|nr:OmpA family protein [Winogradskyella sp.]RNC88049.1 MAG: cell envelope biogenesis protein OmpA [Winogradskyella sp.]
MRILKSLVIITLLSSLSLTAQNSKTKKADKQFNQFQFVKAAKSYEKLIENGNGDTYVYTQLADCYYNMFNTADAEKWYAKALESSDNPELVYKYSEMLKANGKYEASNEQMKRFASMRPADMRAIAFKENPDYLPKILEKTEKFNLQNVEFNSPVSDFGGTVNGSNIYFASARNDNRKTYKWNDEPFLDMYAVQKNTDGGYLDAVKLNNDINTKYHEGLAAFSPDGNTMYFTRESYFEKVYEKDSLTRIKYSQLYLFKATKTGADWDTVEALDINSKDYSIKNPSVSQDGKTIYFASNKPGGYGNYDIYKAAINADGSVGAPENLGQKVNTEGQEMFPFISSDQTLYFSSNGHMGLGGLDVFYTKEIDGKIAPVRNIGVPINSNADDFAFTISSDNESGYVSSNRAGGKGSDDIYEFKKLQPLCDVIVIAEVLDDETRLPLQGATVTLVDDQGNRVVSKNTDASGHVEFLVECESTSELEVVMDGYDSKKVTVKTTRDEEENVRISLDPIEKIIVEDKIELAPIYFDFDKSNITAKAAFELDKLVQIMNKYPDLVVKATSHTDYIGSNAYNLRLSDRRAKTTVQYVISKGINASRISGEGKGETEPKIKCGTNCTDEERQTNRRSEFLIVSGGPSSEE